MKVGIKEIAAQIGTSPSTVSAVLRGDGEEQRISKETQKRVYEAAKRLNYQPNMFARQLREKAAAGISTIAFCWETTIASSYLQRCLQGVQHMMLNGKREFDLQVYPYEATKLGKAKLFNDTMYCDGIIVSTPSGIDIVFLESLSCPVPIVVLNAESDKFSHVVTEGDAVARILINFLSEHNISSLAAIWHNVPHLKGIFVSNSLVKSLKAANIEFCVFEDEPTYKGGYHAMLRLIDNSELTRAVFFPVVPMAVGAMRAITERGLRVPDDVKIVTFGRDEYMDYLLPAITYLELPLPDMMESAVELLLDHLNGKHIIKGVKYHPAIIEGGYNAHCV